jgi:hypothetical protein
MTSSSNLNVAAPKPTSDTHSQFALNATAVANWLSHLPLANLGESTRQLFQALSELSHVACKTKDRFEILEKIRPKVHYVTESLSQHYLNKPIILLEKTEKIVLLAETLNTHLANGYCQTYQGFEAENRLMRPKEAMATSLHRALTEHSCILLRNYQLYRNTNPNFWKLLHSIYHCAQLSKLTKYKIEDKVHGDGTVLQAYLRPLMLACSRPHQLPQSQIIDVYEALNQWTAAIELRSDRLESCVFLLNPTDDAQPIYRELVKRAPGPEWLGIDTKYILNTGTLSKNNLHKRTSSSKQLPKYIIDQLSIAWSSSTSRTSDRVPCNEPALIALGMNTAHFYIANQLDFEYFQIQRDEAERSPDPFISDKKADDPWSANTGPDTRDLNSHSKEHLDIEFGEAAQTVETINYVLPSDRRVQAASDNKHQYLRSRILDTSSNGFRIELPEAIKIRIRTGELIGIKANDFDGWRLAVVRWLRSDDHYQMGVETLATTATPYSMRIVHSSLAVQEYQRAMLLPGGQLAPSPLLLMSDISGFSSEQTVELIRPGHTMRVKLGKSIACSNAFKLFTFSDVTRNNISPDPRDPNQEHKGEFNQLWDIL